MAPAFRGVGVEDEMDIETLREIGDVADGVGLAGPPRPADISLPDSPGRWLTEAEVMEGCIVGRDDQGRIVALVDVVDPEPPGLYESWGVLP